MSRVLFRKVRWKNRCAGLGLNDLRQVRKMALTNQALTATADSKDVFKTTGAFEGLRRRLWELAVNPFTPRVPWDL